MNTLEIFEPAMCCSTGVCGAEPDETLIRLTADLQWLKQQGIRVERYNLSQQPMVFAERDIVSEFLNRSGEESLPLVMQDGCHILLAGRYPTRDDLARWFGLNPEWVAEEAAQPCCSGKGCCE